MSASLHGWPPEFVARDIITKCKINGGMIQEELLFEMISVAIYKAQCGYYDARDKVITGDAKP